MPKEVAWLAGCSDKGRHRSGLPGSRWFCLYNQLQNLPLLPPWHVTLSASPSLHFSFQPFLLLLL